MGNKYGRVNSNYGWQWNRNNQLDYVIDLLERDPRQDKLQLVFTMVKKT
jgi:hypothetical protein